MPIKLSEQALDDCKEISDSKLRHKLAKKLERYSTNPPHPAEKNIEFRGYVGEKELYRLRLNGERVMFLWPNRGEHQIVLRVFDNHDEYVRALKTMLDR